MRIIVIDDDQSIGEIMRRILAPLHNDVTIVHTAPALCAVAHDAATAHIPFDLLITDVDIEDSGIVTDGIDQADTILHVHKDVFRSVLVMSGDDSNRNRAHEKGWPFLKKPFDRAELTAAIEMATKQS